MVSGFKKRSFCTLSGPKSSQGLSPLRYDFVPPVKYNFLDADEAEQKFEERNKTLNYFSIMLSKKLKNSAEEGEEGVGGAGVGGDKKEKVAKEKAKGAGSGLVCVQTRKTHTHTHARTFKETVVVTSYPILFHSC